MGGASPLQLLILCPAGFPNRMSLVVETVFLVQTGIGSNYLWESDWQCVAIAG
ncbi:MAG: hypothetical protein OEW26_08610 [Nitrospirota bacterium]|nr:hypothetical protein [Nitrospirota bacterium]